MRISDWSSDVCSSDLLIERQGCSTGLVATEGFSDVTEIGNERKYDLYDLNIERAPPLVERRMRGEISARTDATGQELTSVNADQVRTVVGRLVQEGAKSIAVRSEEHTSELQSLMRISYAVFCLKKKKSQYKRMKISIYQNHCSHSE